MAHWTNKHVLFQVLDRLTPAEIQKIRLCFDFKNERENGHISASEH